MQGVNQSNSYLVVLNNALPTLVQLCGGARQEQVKKEAKRKVEYLCHTIFPCCGSVVSQGCIVRYTSRQLGSPIGRAELSGSRLSFCCYDECLLGLVGPLVARALLQFAGDALCKIKGP